MAVPRRFLEASLCFVLGTASDIIFGIFRFSSFFFLPLQLLLLCTQHVAYGIILPKTHISAFWATKDTRKNVLHAEKKWEKTEISSWMNGSAGQGRRTIEWGLRH